MLACRIIEQNIISSERLLVIALDWAKAFDSIDPERFLVALTRFGLPLHFVNMIAAIYSERRYFVRVDGMDSNWKRQRNGIVQGCPLSPFLFTIAMSCLMHDADAQITAEFGNIRAKISVTRLLLYADDTLILE